MKRFNQQSSAFAGGVSFAPVIRFPGSRKKKVATSSASEARKQAAEIVRLRVFAGSIDGARRALVAAMNQAEAVRLIRSVGFPIDEAHFTQFFCQSANVAERALAIAAPGVVFSRCEEVQIADAYAAVGERGRN